MSDSSDPAQFFEKHEEPGPNGRRMPYRLLPPLEATRQPLPLILFLHGAGERGSDNERQLIHGGKVFTSGAFRREFPCWVLAPQCPEGEYWVALNWRAGENRQPREIFPGLAPALAVAERLQQENKVDGRRVYVMGLSMGGFGTWDLVTRYPKRFAGAVPICGGGDPGRVESLGNLPLWVFHGADDEVVAPIYSRRMVEAIRAAGGDPRYTEYPGVGHNSWDPAFAEPELFPWLFAQRQVED